VSAESTRIDRDGLLCALVLAPTTFARNRFFALYTEPWARRTRSRAAQLRTIVRHLAALTPKPQLHDLLPLEDGGTIIRYGVPDLRFERTAFLEPLELAVVRFALSRRPRAVATTSDGRCEPNDLPIHVTEEDRRRVEQALAKLSQRLGPSSLAELENSRF
jgi:hypothetical protein